MAITISQEDTKLFEQNGFSYEDVGNTVNHYRETGLADNEIQMKINARLNEFKKQAQPTSGATISAYKPPTVLERIKDAFDFTTQVPVAAFMEQTKDNEAAELRTKGIMLRKVGSDLSEAEKARINELDNPFSSGKYNENNNYGIYSKFVLDSNGEYFDKGSPAVIGERLGNGIKKLYADVMKQTGIMYDIGKEAGVLGTIGGIGGLVVGGIAGGVTTKTPQGVVQGASGGFKTGASLFARTAVAKKSFELETGFMRQELEQLNKEFVTSGVQPLTDGEIDNLSLSVGAVNASLEYYGLGAILKSIPNSEKILGAFGKEGMKELAKDATFRSQLSELTARLVKAGIQEGSTEMLQETSNFVAGNLARKMRGVAPKPLADKIDDILNAGLVGSICAISMGGIGTAAQVTAVKVKQGIDAKTAKTEADSMTIDERNDFINDNMDTLVKVANEQADTVLKGGVTYNKYKEEFIKQGAEEQYADQSAQLIEQAHRVIADKFGEEGIEHLKNSNLQILVNNNNKKQIESEERFIEADLGKRDSQTFSPEELETDARTFQYKENSDEEGVTERLKGVEKFDPMFAGKVIVYENKEGQKFIVDGHQRLGLAKRLGDENIKLEGYLFKEKDGYTPEQVRVLAAQKNIAEGSGTAVDTAKIIKEIGINKLPKSLPTNSTMVKDGISLSRLGDEAFQKVANEDITPAQGARIADAIRTDELKQSLAVDAVKNAKPENLEQVYMLAREIAMADTTQAEQINLFGTQQIFETTAIEKIKIVDKTIKSLKSDKKIFGSLLRNQGKIQEKGKNKLDKETNEEIKQVAAVAIDLIERLASREGNICDKANELAKQLKDEKITMAEAVRQFREFVTSKETLKNIWNETKKEIKYNQEAIQVALEGLEKESAAAVNKEKSEQEKNSRRKKYNDEYGGAFQAALFNVDCFENGQQTLFNPLEFYQKGFYQGSKIAKKIDVIKSIFKGRSIKELCEKEPFFKIFQDELRDVSDYTVDKMPKSFKGVNIFGNNIRSGKVIYLNMDNIGNDIYKLARTFRHEVEHAKQHAKYEEILRKKVKTQQDLDHINKHNACKKANKEKQEYFNKHGKILGIIANETEGLSKNEKENYLNNLDKKIFKIYNEYERLYDNYWNTPLEVEARQAGLKGIERVKEYEQIQMDQKGRQSLGIYRKRDVRAGSQYSSSSAIEGGSSQEFRENEKGKFQKNEHRGQFRIDEDGTAIIDIFENGDASTIVHELAHFYLYSVETLAQKNKRAEGELKEIYSYLGRIEGQEYNEAEMVEFHEKFARGFEAYLLEGSAPTRRMLKVFQNFKSWLKDIYTSLKDLDVEFSDASVKLFDRIFTTDEEYEKEVLPKYEYNYERSIQIQEQKNDPMYRFKKALNNGKTIISDWYDKVIIPIDTRLAKISPELKQKLRNHTAALAAISGKDLATATDFLTAVNEMKNKNEEDYYKLDLALKNRDSHTVNILCVKYGFKDKFEAVRDILDDIYSEALEVGLDVGYLENYYPRKVKREDSDKFIEYIEALARKEKMSVTNQVLKLEDAKISMILRELKDANNSEFWTQEDKAKFINNRIRGFGRNNILLSRNGSLKYDRSLDELDGDFNQFYEGLEAALITYISASRKVIEARKFFGNENPEVGKLRATIKRKKATLNEVKERTPYQAKLKELNRIKYKLSPLEIKLEALNKQSYKNANTEDYIAKLENKTERLKKQIEWVEKADPFQVEGVVMKRLKDEITESAKKIKDIIGDEENVKDSIGQLVNTLAVNGDIVAKDERKIREMLEARFAAKSISDPVNIMRDFTYAVTLNDITNAITQFGDLAFSVYKYGFENTKGGFLKPFGIRKEDLGLNDIAYEFSNPSTLSKWIKKQFEWIGLSAIDGFGKNTIIQASILNAQKKIKNNDSVFDEKLKSIFGDNIEEVKKDLLSGETTDNTIVFAFNELADIQPISEDQTPELYQNGGGFWKLFYTLKTYGIKALDIARTDIISKIEQGIKTKNKKLTQEGLKNLVRLQMLLWLFGVPIDALKDLISNRDINLFESIIDTLIPAFLVNRYMFRTAGKEGVGAAVTDYFFNPAIASAIEKDGKYAVTNIPFIGKPLYNLVLKDRKKDKK